MKNYSQKRKHRIFFFLISCFGANVSIPKANGVFLLSWECFSCPSLASKLSLAYLSLYLLMDCLTTVSFLCSPQRASETPRRQTSAQRLWGSPSLLCRSAPISWFWSEATDHQPGPGQRTAERSWLEISLPHTTYFLSDVSPFLDKAIDSPPPSGEDSGVEDAGPPGDFRLPAIGMLWVTQASYAGQGGQVS